MSKKAYKLLIALAVIVVVISVAITIGIIFKNNQATEAAENTQQTQPVEVPVSTEQPLLPEDSFFSIRFFDVGEGDSALVECDGHYLLIDGGNPGSSSLLYAYLKQHKIDYLDYIICTHAHTDHVGGLAGALNYATVGLVYAPVSGYNSRAFNSFVKYLDAQEKEITIPNPGDRITLGSATGCFLGPVDMSLADMNMNNSSIVLQIKYGSTTFLFTGDAEIEEELSLVTSKQELKSTLHKVGHHGSSTSSSELFLSEVSPEYCVISVGKENEYGHPHGIILERLSKYTHMIYRTDICGDIICHSDGSSLTFEFNTP